MVGASATLPSSLGKLSGELEGLRQQVIAVTAALWQAKKAMFSSLCGLLMLAAPTFMIM